MKRLLVSACLAGLAISGATTSAMAQNAGAATATGTTAATDKPIFPIFPKSASKPATIKTASAKAGKPVKGKIPLPTPKPAEAEATDGDAAAEGAAQTEVQADATPADTQAAEPPAADAAPEPATAKATEAKPSYMRTGHPEIDALVATHARANNVPEALVHRVIVRESKYQKDLVGSCGCIGLMQIKLATARGLGYTGDAKGLHDANTNLTYGVKYLAGAYRAANGDHDRAVHYFAKGYYEAAKRQRLADAQPFGKLARVHAPLDITPKPPAAIHTAKNASRAPLDKQATASR
ncbi:transglycosylase SLT domain-containing protein [Bradyrhizobium sp. STM 3557]|uniref:transglycosylase SLT domain-containing protein n=1 Tax=Bradyrhizobium sp. STM 3557 TaxID=578920 RepID=UPI00388CF288